MSIKNVVLAGASGTLGTPVLKELIASKKFNITVLTRESSSSTFPSDVTVKKVDFANPDSLKSALVGQDALVSTLSAMALDAQIVLIDAAVAAGVKRLIPSEFGCDTASADAVAAMGQMFQEKEKIVNHLKSKQSDTFSWTVIANGPFLDWLLGPPHFFAINPVDKTSTLYNGGTLYASITTLSDIGKSVAGALSAPLDSVSNRYLYVHTVTASQKEIIAALQAASGDEPSKWKIDETTSDQGLVKGRELMGKGEFGPGIGSLLNSIIWGGDKYGNDFRSRSANQIVGISERSLKDLVAEYVK